MTSIGERFGRLTVVGFAGKDEHHRKHWFVKCECGVRPTFMTRGDALVSGRTVSCGCYNRQRTRETHTTHGLCPRGPRRGTYGTWASMLQRCQNPKSTAYRFYGGRGISVCQKWQSFEGFWEDMGPKPDGWSIDRIDNSKGYYSANCRWASHSMQMSNTRGNHLVEVSGELLTVTRASKKVGIDPRRIFWYVCKYGVTHQDAFDLYAARVQ